MKKLSIMLLSLILTITALSGCVQFNTPHVIPPPIATEAPNTENIAQPCDKALTAHFIDVGQGDCEFIELPNNQTMLIDAGNKKDGADIINYIKDSGFEKIDYRVYKRSQPGICGDFMRQRQYIRASED